MALVEPMAGKQLSAIGESERALLAVAVAAVIFVKEAALT